MIIVLFFHCLVIQITSENMSISKLEPQYASTHTQPRQINFHTLYQELAAAEDPEQVTSMTTSFFTYVSRLQGVQFERGLQLALKIISRGYSNLLVGTAEFIKKVKAHFVQLSKFFKTQPSLELQYRLFFTVSTLAQFVRQERKIEIPFDREFLEELLDLEVEQLNRQSQSKLLAILGVLYSNLVGQPQLFRELKMGKRLKQNILSNYQLIEEVFTLKLFNQCIMQLQMKKLAVFTLCELERYGVKQMLTKTLPGRQVQMLAQYIQKMFPRRREQEKTRAV